MELTEEANIENLGVISYIEAPFNQALDLLIANGDHLISARDLAFARIKMDSDKDSLSAWEIWNARNRGEYSSLSTEGSFVREGIVRISNKCLFLIRESPLIKYAKEAVEANRNGEIFHLSEKDLEYFLNQKDTFELNSSYIQMYHGDEFDNPLTRWLFKDKAEKYCSFLTVHENTWDGIDFDFNFLVDRQKIEKQKKKPIVGQIYMNRLCCYPPDYDGRMSDDPYSEPLRVITNLNANNRVRGLKRI